MEEEKTFLELFEANVRKSPEKTAIVDRDGERCTTYGALDELSGRICTALKKRGVGKGDIIPIYLDRKMEFIAAEIGILKCGAAFVALTLEYPQARVEYIRKDCGGAFVLDEALLAEALLEEPSEAVAVTPKDPAFAVYTSGSTGNPKGILHTHKSLASSVRRHSKVLETTPEDIQLSCGPFSFIVMAVDVYLPLGMGYTTHILPEEKRKNIRKIEAYILEHKITVSFISPQMLKMLSVKHSSLRAIATGSERVSRITGDGYHIFNMFGCSETAGVATAFCIDQQYDNTPIGKAAPEIQALLLDDAGNPVPQGEEGELCIVGDIASQYINLPEQTKKAFVVQEDGRVLFHTNDICRALPDGNLVYVNRKDWMVKINGQRVETGEIEAVLSDIPQVDTAAVKGFQNDYGQTYLCGFYTVKVPVEEAKVRAVLEEKLPEYMIPQHLVQLEKMPVNQNGKLDRKQLKAPDTGKMQREYREPENEKQAAVCRAFEKVLNLEKVGILDNFFEMGGDSIQAMMLSCELNDISVDYIYEGKTPEKIAEFYEETKRMQVNAREDEKFQNQFDEQGRMRILAGMRYYKKTEDENNMPRTTLLLKEEVDPACLEYAAQMTFPRYIAFV